LFVRTIINEYYSSNCYFISLPKSNFVIVDPAFSFENEIKLLDAITPFSKVLVILTHEHFDHISGVNKLTEMYNFNLVCSEDCSKRISDPKKNLSYYQDNISPFGVSKKPEIILKENSSLSFCNIVIDFFLTPGHSEGSICFLIGNNVFTGDTFLGKQKTPLQLPGANKDKYYDSIINLNKILKNDNIIYPGHGNPFAYKEGML
jgi:glyoxylase-like metal-dependent hydrolase (beta-lactamase superfamily II)